MPIKALAQKGVEEFARFETLLSMLDDTIQTVLKVSRAIPEDKAKDNWRVPHPTELVGAALLAEAAHKTLHRKARKWAGELLSRTWLK